MEENPVENDSTIAQETLGTTLPSYEPGPDPTGRLDGISQPTENFTALGDGEQGMQTLLTEMAALRRDFDIKVKYDESKERLITSLHKELQFYREGLHFRILKPIFIDLISLYDDFGTLIEGIPLDVAEPGAQMAQHLEIFQETVEELLHRNGVDTFTIEQDTFLPSKQRNLRIVATPDPAQDKHIAKRVRLGFTYEEKLLRPEVVETFKYTPSINQNEHKVE